ncbi:hypothetical protein D3C78_1910750 [compost metagenome]
MGGKALEAIEIFKDRQIVGGAYAVEWRRMPGKRRIDVIKQARTHHECLARAAFFPGATVITHGAS